MAEPAPQHPVPDFPFTHERHLRLVADGVLTAGDRVELLEGVVVAMSPHNARHAAGVRLAGETLQRAVGARAVVQVQLPLIAGPHSVPEPDVAVLPGRQADYFDGHPTTALLVVEVSDSTLAQERLTKAAIYAAAGIPEYWIVNLIDDRVEVFRSPEPAGRRYATSIAATLDDRIEIASLPGVGVDVRDLLPTRPEG